MKKIDKYCKICNKQLWESNKSGYCLVCYNKNIKATVKSSFCIECGKELNKYRPGKRCYSCVSKLRIKNNPQFGENNSNYKGGKKEVKCDYCGEIVLRWEIKRHNFCNTKCLGNWYSINYCGKNNANYIHGEANFPYPSIFSDKLKAKIRERDNYICQCCGIKEEDHIRGNKNIKLIIHHIDYNKENCIDTNLITVCNKCNVKANVNRASWLLFFQDKICTII